MADAVIAMLMVILWQRGEANNIFITLQFRSSLQRLGPYDDGLRSVSLHLNCEMYNVRDLGRPRTLLGVGPYDARHGSKRGFRVGISRQDSTTRAVALAGKPWLMAPAKASG